MTRAAILARVSTADQAEADRHSLPVQTEQMQRLAERNGWEVVARFEIPGESAYTHLFAKRPQFLAALEAAERGEFEVLIVYDFSRFARNQLMAHASLQRLRDAGVRLFGSNGVDYTADDDMAGMEAIFAARASRDHSRRISSAIERRHLLGLPTGDIPFGYQRGDSPTSAPVIVPEEANAIRWAYRRFVSSGGYQDIARTFNEWGLQPHSKPRRIGDTGMIRPAHGEFSLSSIQAILENPFYLGYVTHKGERRRGQHEAIIDPELWESAQARKRRQTRAPKSTGLLAGMVICEQCGRSLWAEMRRERFYGERYRGPLHGCPNENAWWRASEVEGLLGRSMAALSLESGWLSERDRHARRRPATNHAKLRQTIDEQRRRALNAYMQGGMSDEAYAEALASLKAREAQLPQDVDAIQFAGERVTEMARIWEIAAEPRKRELTRELLRSVRMDTKAKSVRLDPWPEYSGLFGARRDFVELITPGWGRTALTQHSGLYLPVELGVAS